MFSQRVWGGGRGGGKGECNRRRTQEFASDGHWVSEALGGLGRGGEGLQRKGGGHWGGGLKQSNLL